MKALGLLIIPVVLSFCCASARADLTVGQIGPVEFGNSYTIPVSLLNSGLYDLFVVEVVGDTFEPTPLAPAIVASPGTWTGTWVSPTLVYAAGPVFSGDLGLALTFDGAAPPTTAGILMVNFSAFTPGAENATHAVGLVWDGDAFVFTTATLTSVTRSGLASLPVPGGLFLGMIGFGLVGLARKRLH
ncbi:MAG: hypothetical protein IH989_07110 [Planctomycetes bacterium]|nr:hypothetical protein [Planctomycetota bacterium]